MQTTFSFIFIKEMKALHVALSKCHAECDEACERERASERDFTWLSVLKNGAIKVRRRPVQRMNMDLYYSAHKHAPSAPLQG